MIRYLSICIWFISFGNSLFAIDYRDCSYHNFKNGKISTSECYDANHRFGKSRAYDINGSVIYEKEIRSVAGNSYVEFSYYESGAVKRASWHSAPDGGIQWYSSVTEFSEDGKVTKYMENNFDDSPSKTVLRSDPKKRQEKRDSAHTAYCAVIYASEYWFTNTTPYAVIVEAVRGSERTSTTLRPGETLKGGQLILAQQFDDPSKSYQLSVRPASVKVKQKFIVIPADKKPQNTDKEHRRYYFEVRKIV